MAQLVLSVFPRLGHVPNEQMTLTVKGITNCFSRGKDPPGTTPLGPNDRSTKDVDCAACMMVGCLLTPSSRHERMLVTADRPSSCVQ
jgi:hypothetical protein